jgi:hypothetical protein
MSPPSIEGFFKITMTSTTNGWQGIASKPTAGTERSQQGLETQMVLYSGMFCFLNPSFSLLNYYSQLDYVKNDDIDIVHQHRDTPHLHQD